MDAETVTLSAPHPPHPIAIKAFKYALHDIRRATVASRHDWNKHEPRMWSRAGDLSDEDLVAFDIDADLVLIRTGPTPYGQIIFGKLRLPAINDERGEGFLHVRVHHTPGESDDDVKFHSIFTDANAWNAIQTDDVPLEFFNE